ncbi:MAG: transposase [Acidobacteriaceae bacterium]|nr:transposase [Acidobacteriaceae bacterium]MBV9976640.1 transposase [Hyphomicrobiales bacterium]
MRPIARSHENERSRGAIHRDHVHMLLSVPPRISMSRAVHFLKGKANIRCFPNIRLCASATGPASRRGVTGVA